MLGNFLQQTTSADEIFRCIFFLGPLRVNEVNEALNMECAAFGMKFGLFIFNHLMIRIEVESSMCESEVRLVEQ